MKVEELIESLQYFADKYPGTRVMLKDGTDPVSIYERLWTDDGRDGECAHLTELIKII